MRVASPGDFCGSQDAAHETFLPAARRGGTMSPNSDPESNSSPNNYSLLRGLILAGFALTSLFVLATFNHHARISAYAHIAAARVGTVAKTASIANPVKSVPPTAAASARAVKSLANLPMDFEINRGQVNASAKYLARGADYSLFLTDTGAVLSLERFKSRLDRAKLTPKQTKDNVERKVLRMDLAGSNPRAQIAGLDKNSAISNYFAGSDPSKWHTRIPHYNKVHYGAIYPGVDLVYYGTNHKLEYDFIVKANADPSRIKMQFSGADKLALEAHGDVTMRMGAREIVLEKPVVYQEIGGERHAVAGSYRVKGDTVSIALAAYDRSRPLVIDPSLGYSLGYATYVGGSGPDGASAIAVDANLDAYLTGVTCSVNFPITFDEGNNGCNAFVTELNPGGTGLIYSTYIEADSFSIGTGIAVDGSGEAYVIGAAGGGLPTTQGVIKSALNNSEESNAFVVKLNPTGNTMLYSTYLGGSNPAGPYLVQDTGLTIALLPGCSSNCNAYLGGSTDSSNFPTAPTAGAIQPANG